MNNTAESIANKLFAELSAALPEFVPSITAEFYQDTAKVCVGLNTIHIAANGSTAFNPTEYSGFNLAVAKHTAFSAKVIADVLSGH